MKHQHTIISATLISACTLLSGAMPATATAQERVLNVTNWAEYIAEDTIDKIVLSGRSCFSINFMLLRN